MLRGSFGDKSEAPARALCAIAEEHLAAVGDLLAVSDPIVADPSGAKLRGRNTSKVEEPSVTHVRREDLVDVREVLGNVGSHLIVLFRYRRSHKSVDTADVLETLEGSCDDAAVKPSPTRVQHSDSTSASIDQNERDTVRNEHGERDMVIGHQRVSPAFSVDIRSLENVAAVHLSNDQELIRGDVDRLGDPTAIFLHTIVVVADVIAQVQRVVRRFADAAVAPCHEGVNPDIAKGRDRKDAQGSTRFRDEGQLCWHEAQCPITSRACEVTSKPCCWARASTIEATVRSKARLGVTSTTLPHSEHKR